jgi:polyhydroxyalkanoate synthesis regulator phasin
VFFTTNHVTEQMRALGWATTSVAEAAAERIEALEARVRVLEAEIARLEGDRRPPAS